MLKELGLAAIATLVLSSQLKAEEPYYTLPERLQFEDDDSYGSWEGYEPLAPLNGSYLHGRRDGTAHVSVELDPREINDRCGDRVQISGEEKQANLEGTGPDALPWPETTFWLYRHNNNVIYITHTMVATGISGCVLELTPKIGVVRGFIIANRLTILQHTAEGELKFETLPLGGRFSTEIPDKLLTDRISETRFDKELGWDEISATDISAKPSLAGLSERCFRNGYLDVGLYCYITTKGPLYGRISFNQFYEHYTQSVWSEKIVAAAPKAKLDSRLFEWGREISLIE